MGIKFRVFTFREGFISAGLFSIVNIIIIIMIMIMIMIIIIIKTT